MKTPIKLATALSIFMLGASCPMRHDSSLVSATEAKDLTVIFSGFGEDRESGLFARVPVGSLPESDITIHVPELSCKRDSCASAEVIRPDGTGGPICSVPKGKTSCTVKLSDILGDNSPVVDDDRGPYHVIVYGYFKDDGTEWTFSQEGVIYVNPLDPRYSRMGCGSPDATLDPAEVRKKCEAQFSTKGRSALCGGGCL